MTIGRILVLLLLFVATPLSADTFEVQPADPTSLAPVSLIFSRVVSCALPSLVTRSGFKITVEARSLPCLSPPLLVRERLDLGVLPAGTYDVVIAGQSNPTATFTVLDANSSVIVQPSVGNARGGTAVNVTADVPECGGAKPTCAPPSITFDGIPSPDVKVTSADHFTAKTPPHAAGAVLVQVVSSTVVRSSFAFRYFDSQAEILPQIFEKVLVPIVYNGQGALGSQWATEITTHNDNAFAVNTWSSGGGESFAPFTPVRLAIPSAPHGRFLVVPRESLAELHIAGRVSEVSRQSGDWGSELPIVREDQFAPAVEILDIPTDLAFRFTLRIYSTQPTTVTIRSFSMIDGNPIFPVVAKLVSDKPCSDPLHCASDAPAFAELSDLRKLFGFALPERIGIRIESAFGGVEPPLWAFASITNNETQRVTLLTPR